MSCKCPQHTKQFKLDAVNYRKEHPDLTQTEVAKNLGMLIGLFLSILKPFIMSSYRIVYAVFH